MLPDETVALGAAQRAGEHLVRYAIEYVIEVLEAAEISGSQPSEHDRSPVPADQPASLADLAVVVQARRHCTAEQWQLRLRA